MIHLGSIRTDILIFGVTGVAARASAFISVVSTCVSLQMMIFSLSGSVLFYMRRFKMYSSFCVSHMEANVFLNKRKPSRTKLAVQHFQYCSISLPIRLLDPILCLLCCMLCSS